MNLSCLNRFGVSRCLPVRLVTLLVGFHCVTVATTADCEQGLEYGDDVKLSLSCISTRPSVSYSRLDLQDQAWDELLIFATIIHYNCTDPNGSVLVDNEVIAASTSVSLTKNFPYLDPGTNCTFSGCYNPQSVSPGNRQLAIREMYCITDSADECLEAELNNCSVGNSVCTNTPGSYECHCTPGYVGNGTHCENIIECDSGGHNCSVNGTCTDTDGGFTCACQMGYSGDGYNCTDIDECIQGANCNDHALCENLDGGFECVCQDGYEGDGYNCTDIDECIQGANCTDHALCVNLDGGFECVCQDGYEGDGYNCIDIDECIQGANCSDHAFCENLDGGFECVCQDGYEGDGYNCSELIRNSTTTMEDSPSSSVVDEEEVVVETARDRMLLHRILVPLAAGLIVISGVVLCVLVSTLVIRSRRKPKILTLRDELSKNDKLDDNFFPIDIIGYPTPIIQPCQSQMSILDFLEHTVNPVPISCTVQNEQLTLSIPHSKINTSHQSLPKLSPKELESRESPGVCERSSCSDEESLSIVVMESCSTQLMSTDQSIAEDIEEQCIQPQSQCEESKCDHVRVNIDYSSQTISTHSDLLSPAESSREAEQVMEVTAPNIQRVKTSSPVYLEQILSHDNSNNVHYYTDSEGYVQFDISSSGNMCTVQPSCYDLSISRECKGISQKGIP